MPSQWERFKQSNIAKIVIGYSLVVWVLIQLIEAVLPTFETPLWVAQTLTFLLILGFPIALLVGWAYEKLPTQATGDEQGSSAPQPAHSTPKKTLVLVGVGSCAVIGLFGFYMMPFIFDESSFQDSTQFSTSRVPSSAVNYRAIRSSINLGETGRRNTHNTRTDIAVSSDGRLLAFLTNDNTNLSAEIFIKDLGYENNVRSLGTVSMVGGSGLIFFSEENDWLYFIDTGKMARVRVEGGAIQTIATSFNSFRAGGLALAEEVIFTNVDDGKLYRVPPYGGPAEPLPLDDPSTTLTYTWPRTLPNNPHLTLHLPSLRELA